jgi:hypothetical protein
VGVLFLIARRLRLRTKMCKMWLGMEAAARGAPLTGPRATNFIASSVSGHCSAFASFWGRGQGTGIAAY